MRIKALKKKYDLEGYAIFVMMLETLTGSELIQMNLTELQYEMLAGDFDVEADRLEEILNYLIKLKMFSSDNGFLRCQALDQSLEPLFRKRLKPLDELRIIEMEKEFPPQKLTETPHSKGENIIEKHSSENKIKKKGKEVKEDFYTILNKYKTLCKNNIEVDVHAEGDLDNLFRTYGYSKLDNALSQMIANGTYSIESLTVILEGS